MAESKDKRLRIFAPAWKSNANPCIQHYHLPDHGNMGVTVEVKQNVLDVQPVKTSNSSMGAKMCAMPLLPPSENGINAKKPSGVNDLSSLAWQHTLQINKQQLMKKPGTIYELKDILKKLSSDADIVMKIPQFLYKLAMKIPEGITSEGKNLDEFELKNGGGLHYQPFSDQIHEGVLFYCTGKNLETLVILPMDLNVQDTCTSWLYPKQNLSESRVFPTKIYQVTSQQIAQKAYFGLRRANKVDIGRLKINTKGNITLELIETKSEVQYITDLALSPYIAGDYIYATDDGCVNFFNMEMGIKISKKLMDVKLKNDTLSWSCQFASHPRCFVCSSETEVILQDLRFESRERTLIFNITNKLVYDDEKIHTVKRSSCSSYLHYIGTSYSLHLLDERFPDHPVLTWKHQMRSQPLFCSVAPYTSKQSKSCEAVILSSHRPSSREAVLFTTQHEGHVKTTSLASPLHISPPGDFVDTLLQNCHSIDPMIRVRTDYPLYGICCISPGPERLTVLQQTTLGDVYYQDFESYDKDSGIPMELGHKQGPGYVACQLDAEVAKRALDWTEMAFAQMVPRRTATEDQLHDVDATDIMRVMTAIPDHTHGCPLCCHCTSENRINVNLTEICSACRIQLQFGKQLCDVAEQNGVLTGQLPETFDGHQVIPPGLPAGMQTIDEMSNSNDPLMKRLVNDWLKDEPASEEVGDDGDGGHMEIVPDCDFITRASPATSTHFLGLDKGSLTYLAHDDADIFISQDLPLSTNSFPYPSTSQEIQFKQEELTNANEFGDIASLEDSYFSETHSVLLEPTNGPKDSVSKVKTRTLFRGGGDEGF